MTLAARDPTVFDRERQNAVARGTAFLRRALHDGTFGLACVGTDGTARFSHNKGHVFTGFFIGEALDGELKEIDRAILLTRILSEEQDGVWGFSPPAPYVGPEYEAFINDADDTAYVLRTLRRLGVNRAPKSLLAFHRPENDLFVTFNAPPGATRLTLEPRAQHNLLAHPEVNANVGLALRGTNFQRYANLGLARQLQSADGHWPSYFYPGVMFATYLFLDLIHGDEGLNDVEQRGLAFVAAAQNANGSWGAPDDPYETALAANALAICNPAHLGVAGASAYLVASAQPDGSWQSDRCVWEFHADTSDVWRAYDRDRALTTALCVLALRRAGGAAV